jgi:hypothetical protein
MGQGTSPEIGPRYGHGPTVFMKVRS